MSDGFHDGRGNDGAACEETAGRLLRHLDGWAAATLLSLGLRTGLLDALLRGPGTSSGLAERAQVSEPNAREWLAAMVTAGYANCQDGTYAAPDGLQAALQPNALHVNLHALLELPLLAPRLHEPLLDAIRDGEGIPYEVHRAATGRLIDRLSRPLLVRHLLQEWIPAVPSLEQRLRHGAPVIEAGCGTGTAACLLARQFPAARITGLDADPEAIALARRRARELGLGNVKFQCADVVSESSARTAQVILVINMLHDLPDLQLAVRQLAACLGHDGVLVAAEPADSSPGRQETAPGVVLSHHARLTHCLQVNLAAGGGGLTGQLATTLPAALTAAGLTDLGNYRSSTGHLIAWARVPPSQPDRAQHGA
jgi:SAM-dependent methyltransferase